MLTRRHLFIFLAITAVLLFGLAAGREVRTMANYTDPDGPRFEGRYAPDPPGFDGGLTVVTWNIRFGEDIKTAVVDLSTQSALQNADLLLLQEMDEQGVEVVAQALQYDYVYFPASVHSHHNRNFGNAILSKWPILEAEKLLLPHQNPSNEQRRNAVRAVISMAGEAVAVYSLHTETYWLPQGQRDEQAQAVAADILAHPKVDRVVVGGDFNTITQADTADLESIMAQAGLARVSAGAGPSVVVAGVAVEADHLFARGFAPVENGTYADTTASDHFPVWVELRVVP